MVTFHVSSSNAKIHAQRVLIPLESMQQLALATGDRVLIKHAETPDKVLSSYTKRERERERESNSPHMRTTMDSLCCEQHGHH